MTVGDWVREHAAGTPPALAARVTGALGPALSRPATDLPDAALAAAEALLMRLLAGRGTRAAALDLLAVDALVTYAFESASDAPTELAGRAGRAMRRLSALTPEPRA